MRMLEVQDRFYYVYSCDLDVNIQIKVGTLEGKRDRPSHCDLIDDPMTRFSGAYSDGCSDLYVTCQVFADDTPMALPVQTAYKAFSTRWNWNEWLTLPVKYSDLPRNAQLALTIWDIYGTSTAVPVGGTTVSLFGKHGTFRQGMHDLRVWPKIEADGSSQTTTPGKSSGQEDDMSRLAKWSKKHRDGHMAKVDWLDRLTFREIEMINEKQKRTSNFLFLMIEFPQVILEGLEYSIVYFEMGDLPSEVVSCQGFSHRRRHSIRIMMGQMMEDPMWYLRDAGFDPPPTGFKLYTPAYSRGGDEVYNLRTYADIVTVPDQEITLENLVESKHHKLARSLRSGPTDRDLKPNAATRDQLNVIVAYPPTKNLTSEEKDLIWKFRFYLSSQKKALTKFLKSVSWNVLAEEKQALELLNRWQPMDVDDALELLSPTFNHQVVRKYAVTRLQQADDEELLLYLLQLVQALKYEDSDAIKIAFEQEKEAAATFPTARRESASSNLQDAGMPTVLKRQRSQSVGDVTEVTYGIPSPDEEALVPEINTESLLDALGTDDGDSAEGSDIATKKSAQMDLATFLITRACNNSTLANYFCWYLIVECDDQDMQTKDPRVLDMYITVLKRFSQALNNGGEGPRLRRAIIAEQQTFMERLVKLVKLVARESGNRKKKTEKLQSLLVDSETLKFNFSDFRPLPLPLDPTVTVTSIQPESASLFKSALMPCRFTFRTADGGEYVTIFKHGDDLRQDQLVLQIITLMDKLLRQENLDLKLTPYKVLATNSKHGFLQFVESVGIAEVLNVDGSIQNFFRKHNPADNGPYGISPEVMDCYVKSCAGYCVITYLLGVGDRHLDNLLVTRTGKLFHVDFGYILGRDPKPMPPPMKLSKEMVDAMGGTGSEHFMDFKKLCYTAFLHLRRSANLILNLFSLMVDANVPDIALEPDKTVKKVQDKFRLDLTDEEAVQYLQSLIDVSVSATMAALMEQMHKLAQYWRK